MSDAGQHLTREELMELAALVEGKPKEARPEWTVDDWLKYSGCSVDQSSSSLTRLLFWSLGGWGQETLRNFDPGEGWVLTCELGGVAWTTGTRRPLRFWAERVEPEAARAEDEESFLRLAARGRIAEGRRKAFKAPDVSGAPS